MIPLEREQANIIDCVPRVGGGDPAPIFKIRTL